MQATYLLIRENSGPWSWNSSKFCFKWNHLQWKRNSGFPWCNVACKMPVAFLCKIWSYISLFLFLRSLCLCLPRGPCSLEAEIYTWWEEISFRWGWSWKGSHCAKIFKKGKIHVLWATTNYPLCQPRALFLTNPHLPTVKAQLMGSFWSSQWVPRTGIKAEVRGTLPSLPTSIGASSLQNDTFPANLTHAEGEKHFPSKVIRERWKLRRKRATRVGKHFIVNRWVRLSSWSVSQAVINMPCNSCNETANRLRRLTQGDAVDHLKMRKPVLTDRHTYFPSEGNQEEHQYHSWGCTITPLFLLQSQIQMVGSGGAVGGLE